MARGEADRAVAEERQRADRLNEQVEALSAEVVRAEKQAEAAVGRAERAAAARNAERARVEALHTTIDELKARQTLMTEMHARELAVAQHDAQVTEEAAAEVRRSEAERRARGLLARLRAAWRGIERPATRIGVVPTARSADVCRNTRPGAARRTVERPAASKSAPASVPHGLGGTIPVTVRLDPTRYERLKIYGVRQRRGTVELRRHGSPNRAHGSRCDV